MLANPPRHLLPTLLLLAVIGIVPALVWAQSNGPVIVTGLSPDAVGNFDADQCRGCDVRNDINDLCDNTCVSCQDAGRTDAAGGCSGVDNQGACEAAFQFVNGVPISCFWHQQSAVCIGCDSSSQEFGQCTNTCFPCADASRTNFAGGSFFPDDCAQFNTQQTCESAWVLNGFSNVPLSCFFANGQCKACEVGERLNNECMNTCAVCEDPAFTEFFNAPGESACTKFAGNEAMCSVTWHYTGGHVPAPCFFTAGTEVNQGGFLFIQDAFDRLGPLVTNGKKLAVCLGCNGTTATEGFEAGFDESTLPGLGWTRLIITDLAAIADFLLDQSGTSLKDAGIVYLPSQEADTPHQGISPEQVAVINLQKATLGPYLANGGGFFAQNQARLAGGFEWLDAVVPGAQARSGDTCLEELELTPPGMTTFPHVDDTLLETFDDHTKGYFIGTFDPLAVLGTSPCRDVTCKEPTNTNLIGMSTGFFDDLCQEVPDEATCNVSWQLTHSAIACAFDGSQNQCRPCGQLFKGGSFCDNECQACDDPTRSVFAGDLNEPNCEGLSGPEACESAWAGGREGLNVSCFLEDDRCFACETEDEITGRCTNSCEPPPGARAVILGPDFSTATPTPTASPVLTSTPVPTTTSSPVLTATATATATPSATLTATPTPSATATAGPPGSLRRFQCYAVDRELTPAIPNVQTADVLSTGTGELRRPTRLCAPADVEGADPTAPADPRHLLGYELRDRAPRFLKVKHVGVTDQFGTIDVNVIRPVLVMTPTRKSLETDPGAPGAIGLDHFQCYHVVGGKTRVDDLDVTDQFGALVLDVKRPFRLCIATSKNDEPIADASAALSCYRIRQEKPRFPGRDPVFVHDQFGAREIAVKRPTELCVPATVVLED